MSKWKNDSFQSSFWGKNSMFWRGTFQLASWGDDGKGQQNNSGYPSWTQTGHLMIINFISL